MTDLRHWRGNRIRLMSSANRLSDAIRRAAWAAPAVAVLGGSAIWLCWQSLPILSTSGAVTTRTPKWPAVTRASTSDWSIVQALTGVASTDNGGRLSKRFRLAGTFFEYGFTQTNELRKAILDDLAQHEQRVVSEGDTIGDVKVVSILAERVVLRDDMGDSELWLSFIRSGQGAHESGDKSSDSDSPARYPYGIRQIGENRWIFDRGRVMDYYRELMDEPERLVKVFDSLKPVYTAGGRSISGYVLGVEGEREFFNAAGLREGDVVRSVNSLPMTNRRRAEFFIKEFVANRASVFALDIERNGKAEKLVYEVR